ncbi:MAG: methyltransferase domain-containing protein [Acidobacteria bacterium]|nr:methyltransferase domain-containing protein [Acidobacteriota bacterium]
MDGLSWISPPPQVEPILEETVRMNFGLASEPLVGALLRILAASKPGGRFLELGTGTGVATAWLLSGMTAGSTLVSVDIDPAAQAIAARFLGNDPRLHLVNAGGLDYLATLPPESFDLVFADAMPGKYENLNLSLACLKPGGFWVGDDLLPQPNWPEGHAAKVPALIGELSRHPRFTILPLAWASGGGGGSEVPGIGEITQ